MSTKGPLVLIAGGCAAMVGAAALTISLASFFSDLPTQANAASVAQVPVKKVKTITLTPNDQTGNEQTGVVAPVTVAAAPASAETPAPAQEFAVAAAPKADELHRTNPRWARNAALPKVAQERQQQLQSAFADDARSEGVAARSSDPFAVMGSGEVELEETIDDLPTPAPRREVRRTTSQDDEPEARGGRTVTINTGVNMRSAGRSGSRIIGTIPGGARVTLSGDCRNWCRVTYKGQTGYIWRSFVGGRSAAPRQRARRATQAQPPRQVQRQVASAQKPSAGLFGSGGLFGRD